MHTRSRATRAGAYLATALLGLLLLTGCSIGPRATIGAALTEAGSSPAAVAPTTPAAQVGSAGTTAATSALATRTANGAGTSAAPSAATTAAIKAAIQQADEGQQRAFAANDPTLMRDAATDDYYAELVRTNQDLATNGVTAIALVALDWGTVAQTGPTTAQATAFETWRTTYADGSVTQQDPERNDYTVVLVGGAWKVQADAHPETTVVSAPNPGASGGGTTPRPVTVSDPGESSNWSGYAATGGSYTAVSGTWTVPQVDATVAGADATWVGIGGIASDDLIQAGTDATVTAGQVRYTAWVEMLPKASQRVPLTVSAGDQVTVTITEQGTGTWLIAFHNQTTGRDYQVTETYTSSHSSAEWVEEAPSSGQRIVALDNFGTVQITGATAVKNGQSVTVGQAGGVAITMIDGRGQRLAIPAALGADGASFAVQRTAVVATTPTPTTTSPTTPRRGR